MNGFKHYNCVVYRAKDIILKERGETLMVTQESGEAFCRILSTLAVICNRRS